MSSLLTSSTPPTRVHDLNKAAMVGLQASIQGSVLLPDDDDYSPARTPWSNAIRHSPALIVLPETSQDIIAAVAFAENHDLPIAIQGSGHGPVAACEGGLLINTSRMVGVTVDPTARTARVQPGTKWDSVIPEAHVYGLAPLNGSSPDVGVVGYTLGGGTGWLARKYGFAADQVRSIDLVTADGQHLHVSAESHPDLFWALRGGGGNFGVVTSLKFDLVPVKHVYGGAVFYPMADAERVFSAYSAWVETLPDEITSSIVLLRLPPLPDLPVPLQGVPVVSIRACAVGDLAHGEALIAPMRALGTPIVDGFGVMPYTATSIISADPLDPLPIRGSTMLLNDLSAQAIDALLEVAGPDVETPLLMVEIRHVAGVASKAPQGASVANRHDAPFLLYAAGLEFSAELAAANTIAHTQLANALRPFASPNVYFNFIGDGDVGPERTRAAFSEANFARLARIKAQHDPKNRFRFNHNLALAIQ